MISSHSQIDTKQRIRNQILQACHSFLLPVARFLLRSGISYREFIEVCRAAFVQVARDDFGIRGRPTNTSRIAAMTGIPRKEIARIRDSLEAYAGDARIRLSPLSDALQLWYTDERFCDVSGNPAPLPFEGAMPSFVTLVKECAGDVPAGAVRSELVRYGAITCDEGGTLHAIRREVVPDSFDMKLISALSFSLARLAETIAYNSDSDRAGPGRIERNVQSDHISARARELLRPIIRTRVEEFSREMDDLFAQYAHHSATDGEPKARVGVGIYSFEDAETD